MIEKDDVFDAEGKLYCVLDSINYNGHNYCLCNVMDNEQTFGATYVVFENFDDSIELVEEEDILNEISPIFSNNLYVETNSEEE